MTPPTFKSMAASYATMCTYYELCVPGLETSNPHFKSSLHFSKRDLSVDANIIAPPTSSQDNQKVKGENNIKLLIKGKKDNKIHVKCKCKDITDGTSIKRKFLIKCNKCQAMVHGKCHNLNAQLFNSNNKHSTTWYCSTCTLDLQNDIKKNAMAEDIKRATQPSPPKAKKSSKPSSTKPSKTTSTTKAAPSKKGSSKSTQNKKDSNKEKTHPTSTNAKSKQKSGKSNNNHDNEKKKKKQDKPDKIETAVKETSQKDNTEPNPKESKRSSLKKKSSSSSSTSSKESSTNNARDTVVAPKKSSRCRKKRIL